MKHNLLHVCFVIDESTSMVPLLDSVLGGFQKIINDQRQLVGVECTVSLFRFNERLQQTFFGKPIQEVKPLVCYDYSPSGITSLWDGIGKAIDDIGVILCNTPEAERPTKNLIVIVTDNKENNSKEYTEERVKQMIYHQESVYNWSFMYLLNEL